MIIDCHTHAQTKEKIEKLLLSMEENKIDKSIIIWWPGIGDKDSIFGITPLEDLIKILENKPNLFLIGSLIITDKESFSSQFEILKTVISARKIVGVKIYLGYEHIFANDARCNPVYELCEKNNLPVMFHTGDTWRFKKAMVRYANPIYIDDVAVNFPNLKIVISHLGNPCWFKETAELIYKNENVFADFSGTLSFPGKFEREYNENLKKEILEIVAYCGTPRKILFGSDFDIYEQKQYIDFLDSFKEFSEEDLEYIKHKNAENLFGI
jgi:hypothetical protein